MSSKLPFSDEAIHMKHGAGGRAMRALIESVFMDGVEGEAAAMDDGAAIPWGDRFLVVTTDAHVIKPIFFPGGDIGRLAVSGVVNDLAMMGACDVLGLTSSVILEEGLPDRAPRARRRPRCRPPVARPTRRSLTGDTKVMGKGEVDGLVISTSGLGCRRPGGRATRGLQKGDAIVITGTIGDHGLAVMSARHELRPGGRPALRRRAPQRAGPGGAGGGRRRVSRDEGPDPRRRDQRAVRDGREGRAWASSSTRPACPQRRGARGRRLAGHRSARRGQRGQGADRGARPRRSTRCSPPCARTRSARARPASAAWSTSRAARCCSTPASAGGASSSATASPCRGSADARSLPRHGPVRPGRAVGRPRHPGAIVREVHVRVGALAGVEPELLQTAYDTCARGGARTRRIALVIEPAAWVCPACAARRSCAARCCAAPAVRARHAKLSKGGDVFLDRLEMEVPDV